MEILLDVSDLEPCEPLERSLEAAGRLAEGDYLRVLHRREPRMLFPLLEQQGFAWEVRPKGPADYAIYIWRRDDRLAREFVHQALDADQAC